jgi:hypothetical protein
MKNVTTGRIRKIVRLPWYVVLLGIYPVISLFATNLSELQPDVIWRPLALSAGATLGVFLILRLIVRDWHRAALTTLALLLYFFLYGHLYEALKTVPFLVPYARHRILLPVWTILAVVLGWLILKRKKRPSSPGVILNIMAILVLALPLTSIARAMIQNRQQEEDFAPVQLPSLSYPAGETPPDIYYIILDAYGSSSVLESLMDFDNSQFLERLRSQGFVVANCSLSNYATTELSLASSLNLNYLSEIDPVFSPGGNMETLSLYLKNNALRSSLERLGYRVVSFETGYEWAEWRDADLYLSQNRWRGWSEFEALLMDTSLLRAYSDLQLQQLSTVSSSPHRERILFALENLPALAALPGPKFVFAHLIIPHEPLDIGPKGEYVQDWEDSTREKYFEGYTRQATFINEILPEIIASILSESKESPIIVIQGDHGPWDYAENVQRLGILNAIHLPEGSEYLYDTMTPVNTFRIILNNFFGTALPLLEDRSYFSRLSDPLNWSLIENPCGE